MSLADRLRTIDHRITQLEKRQQAVDVLDAKVTALLDALAQEGDDEERQPTLTLDGDEAGGERDPSEPL